MSITFNTVNLPRISSGSNTGRHYKAEYQLMVFPWRLFVMDKLTSYNYNQRNKSKQRVGRLYLI